MTPELSPPTRSEEDRRTLIEWAVSCALRVLPELEAERPDDTRPRHALAGGLAWLRGETPQVRFGSWRQLPTLARGRRQVTRRWPLLGPPVMLRRLLTWRSCSNAAKYALESLEAHGAERVEDGDEWQRATVPSELASFVYPGADWSTHISRYGRVV